MDFESLENEDRQALSYLPFRLSGNLVDFIGKTGLHGVFAGVLSACSLAMGRHHEKLMPLLNIIYRDEINDDRDNVIYFIGYCVDYIKYKMLSLSQNRNVLNLEHFLGDQEYVNSCVEAL